MTFPAFNVYLLFRVVRQLGGSTQVIGVFLTLADANYALRRLSQEEKEQRSNESFVHGPYFADFESCEMVGQADTVKYFIRKHDVTPAGSEPECVWKEETAENLGTSGETS